MLTYRQSRLLYARWRRLVRWEFWPMWALYPPIVLYILYLGIKYRSLTLFTLANPGMPHGGIALMSKSQIFDQIDSDNAHLPNYQAIPARTTPA